MVSRKYLFDTKTHTSSVANFTLSYSWTQNDLSSLNFNLWSSQDGAFSGNRSTDNLCVFFPNLGGGVWTRHTHLPEFLIHWSEAELHPRAARLRGQHAESGLQQQISLKRPDASEPRWCCGVKIKQTPVPEPKEAKVKLRAWFTLLLTAFQIPVMSQLSHAGRRFFKSKNKSNLFSK